MTGTPNRTSNVETLRWRDGRLEMIDQRLLPNEVRFVAFDRASDVAKGIRDMIVRGAPAIGCAAAYGVALEALHLQRQEPAEFATRMDAAIRVLEESRPTAVNLFWALDRMRNALSRPGNDGAAPSDLAQLLLTEAHTILAADIAANTQMGEHGVVLLEDGARVLTHCNAGALATAGHGTALGVIRSAIAAGKSISVVANETRPFLQGARLTAWELEQDGIPVTLIADNAAGHLMSRGEIDAVIVGADRIAANGDVANKIGTYTVAVLARRHDIPFYVAAPISTIDPDIANGALIPIEERDADEVRGYREHRWATANVNARNPVFDVTPAELVTALITERGIVVSPSTGSIAGLFARDQYASAMAPRSLE